MTRALLLLAARAVATAHLFTVTACRPDAVPSGTVHTDSAGVAIATAITPRWGPSEGWTVAEAPLLEIGTVTGAPEYQFADVVAAVRLSNGDIVVADRGASELRGYDPEGTFQWRAGGAGEGPGEFQSLDFLGSMAGDSLVTHDRSLQRVQLFDPAGRLARTLRVTLPRGEAASNGSGPDKAIGVVDGRLIIRFIEVADETPTGIVRWLNERVAALDLGDGAANALMVVAGEEVEMHPRDGGGYSQGRFAFGNMPEFGAAAERVAVIDTEAYTVRIFSPATGPSSGSSGATWLPGR